MKAFFRRISFFVAFNIFSVVLKQKQKDFKWKHLLPIHLTLWNGRSNILLQIPGCCLLFALHHKRKREKQNKKRTKIVMRIIVWCFFFGISKNWFSLNVSVSISLFYIKQEAQSNTQNVFFLFFTDVCNRFVWHKWNIFVYFFILTF